MIEKLKRDDIKEAAKLYNKCLQLEIPIGHAPLNKTIKHLKITQTFVSKENGKINGLVSFVFEKNGIKIDFICALKLRKGIGKKLMKKLADFAIDRNIDFIYSNVSSQDERVMRFYESCGFEKYGKYYADENFMLYKIKAEPTWIK